MGRPPVPLLSTDRIASAAMDLVESTGGFTIPELARRLEVSPSSLYNHVSGRAQVVELLRELAMSEVELPADDPGGRGPTPSPTSCGLSPQLCPLSAADPTADRATR